MILRFCFLAFTFIGYILHLQAQQSTLSLYATDTLDEQATEYYNTLKRAYLNLHADKIHAISRQIDELREAVKRGKEKRDDLIQTENEKKQLFVQYRKFDKDAKNIVVEFTRIDLSTKSALIATALDTFLNGHIKEATALLEHAQDQIVVDVEMNMLLAKMYMFEFENTKADFYFKRAIRLDPANLENNYNYAVFLREIASFNEGVWYLEKIVNDTSATDWEMARAYGLSAQMLQEANRFEPAVKAYHTYLTFLDNINQLYPETVIYKKKMSGAYFQLGSLYNQKWDSKSNSDADLIDSALVYFSLYIRTLEINEQNHSTSEALELGETYDRISGLYYLIDALDSVLVNNFKAVQLYENLYKKHPDDFNIEHHLYYAYRDRADACSESGQIDCAIENYREFLKIDRDINESPGKIDTAIRYYRPHWYKGKQYYSYSPTEAFFKSNRADAFQKMAELYLDKNQVDTAEFYYLEAIDLYKKIIVLDSESKPISLNYWLNSSLATAYAKLGALYKKQGKIDRTLDCALKETEVYEKRLKAKHNDQENELYTTDLAGSYAKTGAVYAHLAQKGKAIEYNEKAIKLYRQLFDNFALEKYKDNYVDLEQEVARLKSK